MALAERVDIREVMSIAINAHNLAEDVTGATLRPVDRIAAFGLAGCGTLKRRLSESMWRLRWGRDHRARKEAGELFAALLLKSPWVRTRWNFHKPTPQIAAFALASVLEWEHDRCPQCGGAGSIPRSRGRDVRTHCAVCNGSGRRRVHHGERAAMVGVTMAIYEKHWQRKFNECVALLDQVESEIVGPLQARLKRA